jgi:hypothetical protein
LKNDRGKQICDGEQAGSEKNDVVIWDNSFAALDIFAIYKIGWMAVTIW